MNININASLVNISTEQQEQQKSQVAVCWLTEKFQINNIIIKVNKKTLGFGTYKYIWGQPIVLKQ